MYHIAQTEFKNEKKKEKKNPQGKGVLQSTVVWEFH